LLDRYFSNVRYNKVGSDVSFRASEPREQALAAEKRGPGKEFGLIPGIHGNEDGHFSTYTPYKSNRFIEPLQNRRRERVGFSNIQKSPVKTTKQDISFPTVIIPKGSEELKVGARSKAVSKVYRNTKPLKQGDYAITLRTARAARTPTCRIV